ncbi:DUF4132 domain-containing protein [Actinomadura sp. GTD37]|uniref:DUF4132 domain-containing protein n=1 Tax=Actinomadura sp. GTD37 TaxID=1778030 RepID=UPI0035C1C688
MSDELPPLLVDPPWERDARAHREATAAAKREAVLVPGLEPPAEQSLAWEPGEREKWLMSVPARPNLTGELRHVHEAEGWPGVAREFGDGKITHASSVASLFGLAPVEIVRPLLRDWHPVLSGRSDFSILRVLPARFGMDARRAVFPSAKENHCGWALMPFLDAEVALLMADWLRLKSANGKARDWFARHGIAAAPFLVPNALGERRVPRDRARAALSLIADAHGLPATVEAARRHGDTAAEAIEHALAGETPKAPVTSPVRPPKTPWLDRGALPEVRLRDGRVLPPEAVENLIGALVLSPGLRWNGPLTMYRGLDEVLDRCDRASLAAFGGAVFDRWIAERAPSRSGWVLDQLCRTADDETVRRLGALLQGRWPAPGTDKHAVQVLRVIGTDAALVQLSRIAQRAKAPGRRRTAEDCLAMAAEARGLTAAELADRLVPDLGLDAAGTLVLDYGPRRFTVGFDEALKPYVADEAGRRRKTLPKPGAADDAELAPAAYERFTTLKKEVRGVAADQIRRLERSMVTGRRWSADEFQRYFVEHPLLWHIARRLLWTSDDTAFRLAEDRTFADVDDAPVSLRAADRIGLPHPVDLGAAVPAWSAVFADYEIAQPFAQLGRHVDALTGPERQTGRLERFEGATVPVGALLALLGRDWERGPVGDGGVQHSIVHRFRDVPCDLVVELVPGIAVAAVDTRPEQTLREVRFTRPPADVLDPIVASEVLADLSGLA